METSGVSLDIPGTDSGVSDPFFLDEECSGEHLPSESLSESLPLVGLSTNDLVEWGTKSLEDLCFIFSTRDTERGAEDILGRALHT